MSDTVEPVAAGDQYPARLGAGQQRPHLRGVDSVVQNHQGAPVHQQRAVERAGLVPTLRFNSKAG